MTQQLSKEGKAQMTPDDDARLEEIYAISDRVARQDSPPNEVESALCGAVTRLIDAKRAISDEQRKRQEAEWRANGLWNALIRFLREVPSDRIPGDVYEHGQRAIAGKRCPACEGRGAVEACCGEAIPATYWQPSECCGRMADADCAECRGTGLVHPDNLPTEEADGLPF